MSERPAFDALQEATTGPPKAYLKLLVAALREHIASERYRAADVANIERHRGRIFGLEGFAADLESLLTKERGKS